MAFVRITDILDTEQSRISTELAAVPAPSPYKQYSLKKTQARIGLMRQQFGESDGDYTLRINLEAQAAPPGSWSTAFFAQLDAAVAADTAEGSLGGRGRSD